jgi:hypothetical protein
VSYLNSPAARARVVDARRGGPTSAWHDSDVAVLQSLHQRMVNDKRRAATASRMGQIEHARSIANWRRIVEGLLRDLSRSRFAELTARQRQMVHRAANRAGIAIPSPNTVEPFGPLPKRPPGAR